VSLTSRLRIPEVREFLEEHLASANHVIPSMRDCLNSSTSVLPNGPIDWSLTGMALDYRIRYYFKISPSTHLVAWQGAMRWASYCCFTESDTPEELLPFQAADGTVHVSRDPSFDSPLCEPFSRRPQPKSRSAPAKSCPICFDGLPACQTWCDLFASFFERLDAQLTNSSPVRRRLDWVSEACLARYCLVLALFEQLYRAGPERCRNSPLFAPDPKSTAAELLWIPQETVIEDLCTLSFLFFDRHSKLLRKPSALNPVFAGSADVDGADADLLVDNCLVEIKTTKNPSDDIRRTLCQLLGYALLDYDDRYQIRELGIYFSRQGVLCRCSLKDLLALSQRELKEKLGRLRREFRAVCRTNCQLPDDVEVETLSKSRARRLGSRRK